jgi:hypothetical protein
MQYRYEVYRRHDNGDVLVEMIREHHGIANVTYNAAGVPTRVYCCPCCYDTDSGTVVGENLADKIPRGIADQFAQIKFL